MSGIPYTWQEGLVILGLVMILLIAIIILSVIKKIGIGKDFTLALIKGGIQLFAVALVLTFLFNYDLWYIPIWLLLGIMAVLGGRTSAKRASNMPRAFDVTTPSILLGAGGVLVVLAVTRAMPIERPEFIIPLAGMAFGNSMRICSVALERLIREVRVNRVKVETYLSLGADSTQALQEITRMSIRAALIPTVDNLKTLGVIFIPGAMAGLIIAGTNPLVAAEYQIIVFLMILSGGLVSSMMVVYLARKRILTSSDQIAEWVIKGE
ncbi:MAG: ABC transporter permease [Thermoplasmatota archaeon]